VTGTPRRRTSQRRRPPAQRPVADLWGEPLPLPEVEPIAPSADPTALIRSLGDPPLAGGTDVVLHLATVVDRTATIAAAIALSAGLLTTDGASTAPGTLENGSPGGRR
jgi:hypothetical protein